MSKIHSITIAENVRERLQTGEQKALLLLLNRESRLITQGDVLGIRTPGGNPNDVLFVLVTYVESMDRETVRTGWGIVSIETDGHAVLSALARTALMAHYGEDTFFDMRPIGEA